MSHRFRHPVYEGYSACPDGFVYNTMGQKLSGWFNGKIQQYTVKGKNGVKVSGHVFVYECFHGVVNSNVHVVVHLDQNKVNNAISNLELQLKSVYYKQFGRRPRGPPKKPVEALSSDFKEHPVHKGYYASRDGTVIGRSQKQIKGSDHLGYKRLDLKTKAKFLHVFVYECFNGAIDSNVFDIDHIDSNKDNNRLTNLQALTKAQHRQKTQDTVMWKKPMKMKHEDLPDEIWATPFHPDWRTFQVSTMGRFKTGKTGKITIGNRAGPYLTKMVQKRAIRTHVIIATVWIGNRPSTDHTVDHVDRNPINNAVTNLRWATAQEQAANQTHTKVVEAYNVDGQLVGRWRTMCEAARATNTHYSNIGKVLQGKLSQTGGLWWKEVEKS